MAQLFTGRISETKAVFQGNNTNTFINITRVSDSRKWDKCISTLGETYARDTRDNLLNLAHHGAEGEWESIWKDAVFQGWKNGDDVAHALVWACGATATGKTRLAVFMTKHLEECDMNQNECWVIYVFCGRAEENRDSAASILKGLIFFLCKKEPSLAEHFYNEFRLQDTRLLQDHQIEALWRCFECMIDHCEAKRVYCVIDGIDNCGIDDNNGSTMHSDTLRHFLRKMSTMFQQNANRQTFQSNPPPNDTVPPNSGDLPRGTAAEKLRILILTQELPAATMVEIKSFPQLPLHNVPAVEGLIRAKVRRVSTVSSKTKDPSEEMLETVDKILSSGPSQSFLFVGLVAEKLEGMTLSQLRKYRRTAPKSVEEFHCQTLLSTPPKHRTAIMAMLTWVALAERTLTTSQLTKAIKYSLSRKSFSPKQTKTILKFCPGLVVVNIGHRVVLGQGVLELLFGKDSPLLGIKQLQGFASDIADAQSELANACVAYLQDSANLEKSRTVRLREGDKLNKADKAFFQKHPFLEYAIINWTYHAKRGNIEKLNFDVAFFGDKLPRRRLWWESYWISLPLRQWVAWKWTTPGNFSLLHLAAFFDIVPLAKHVEQQGQLDQLMLAEDHYGMKPINWATEKSATGMVQFLLEKGDFDYNALLQAARAGQVPIIRILLENRHKRIHSPQMSSPISSPTTPSSPLQSFRKSTLRSLSDFSKHSDRADKSKDGPLSPIDSGYGKAKYETPLHIAATYGHDEAVKILLDANESIHATTDGGWTPLHNAAWFGRVPVVERLVAAEAKPNATTKDGLTPLHCAVKNSQPEVVELLLDRNAVDMDAEDQFGIAPFHMACKCHDFKIMSILHAHGVDIERRTRMGWTPLMSAAVAGGAYDVTRWLLEHNADVTAVWNYPLVGAGDAIDLNALDLAKSYKRHDVAELLQKHGAVDNKSLASRSSLDLPLPEALEESYDLPTTPEISILDLERTDTDDDQLSSDEKTSSEDDAGESSDEGISDDESSSQNASGSIIDEGQHPGRNNNSAVKGLGILQEVNLALSPEEFPSDDAAPQATSSSQQRAHEQQGMPSLTSSLANDVNGDREPDVPFLVEEPVGYFRTVGPSDDNFIPESSQSDGLDTAAVDPLIDRHNRRKSSGSKSPNAMSAMLTRINWGRMSSLGSDIKQSSSNGIYIATDSGAVVSGACGDAPENSQPSKGEGTMLSKFKGKRAFSWKKDNDSANGENPSGMKPSRDNLDH